MCDAVPPPIPSAEWYYVKNGQRLGPITSAALSHLVHTNQLSMTDIVWKLGMSDWVPVGICEGLAQRIENDDANWDARGT